MASSLQLRSIIHSSVLCRRRRGRRHLRHRARRNPSRPPHPTETGQTTECWRDWAGLPPDVLWEILRRLPTADNLCGGAAGACAAWRRFSAHEPALWRRIDLLDGAPVPAAAAADADAERGCGRIAMGRAALERSAGRCEAFSGHADADFLYDIAARHPRLRSLHVRSSHGGGGGCIHVPSAYLVGRVVRRLPLLERLVLSRVVVCDRVLAAVLDHCPRLELLDLGGCGTVSPPTEKGARLLERCRRTIKRFTPPPWDPLLPLYLALHGGATLGPGPLGRLGPMHPTWS